MTKVFKMNNKRTAQTIITIMAAVYILLLCGCGNKSAQTRQYKIAAPPSSIDRNNNGRYMPANNNGYQFAAYTADQQSQQKVVNDPSVYGTLLHEQPTNEIVSREYHVGSGDVLLIKIDQLIEPEKESVLKVEIDRNGLIYLPILNHVSVGGMTIDEIHKTLLTTLATHYIKNPRVDISVDAYNSKKVLVLGEVKRPGSVSLKHDSVPVLEAINEAGGLTSNVSPYVEIMRGAYQAFSNLGSSGSRSLYNNQNSTQYQRELIPLARLLGEGNRDQINPLVFPGDVIRILPITEGFIYFSGEFNRTGSKPYRRPLTLIQALSVAGGPTNISAPEKCKILRRNSDGTEREININVDKVLSGENENIMLACNDTLIMPHDPWKKFWNGVFGLISGGVRVGVDTTYDAAEDMGWPGSERYQYEQVRD